MTLTLVAVLGILTWQAARFAWVGPEARRRRLMILETNYGRDAGWYVERQGRRLAALTAPRWVEMFLESYQIEPLTEDPYERLRIVSDRDWWLQCLFVFRNRALGEVAPYAFPAGDTFPEPGRVTMRGLYLPIDEPTLWEACVLWWRKRTRKRAP